MLVNVQPELRPVLMAFGLSVQALVHNQSFATQKITTVTVPLMKIVLVLMERHNHVGLMSANALAVPKPVLVAVGVLVSVKSGLNRKFATV
jgi:hypothetical protein